MSYILDALQEPIFEESGLGVPVYVLPIGIIALIILMLFWAPQSTIAFLGLVFFLWPVWVPPMLFIAAWFWWVRFRRAAFLWSQDYVLLEIRVPSEIEKSPLAMEAVLSGIHLKPGEGEWYSLWWKGKVRPWWSLEIVSFGGEIHYYIWTRKGFKRNVEANFYAQYPNIQIVEVEDYAIKQTADMDQANLWGCNFKLTKDDVYPIKTYVEYGLDKDPKEEYKIDPAANMLEFMSTLGKGEQIWIQIMVQVTQSKWRDEGRKMINYIRKYGVFSKKDGEKEEAKEKAKEGEDSGFMRFLGKDEEKAVEAIERNTSKNAFDVGMRGMYIANEGHFDGSKISGFLGMFKQFGSESMNGFAPTGGMTAYSDFPWESAADKVATKKGILDSYKRRSFFHPPYNDQKPFVLSTEELATIFRLPGRMVQAPALPRIQTTTGEPPSNLPI